MLTPVYTDPQALEMPDIYMAVYDYVLSYALPAMQPENIYCGWQNWSALPPETNEYAIISIISNVRHGTSIETLEIKDVAENEPKTITVSTHYEVMVQVDCYSDSDNAWQRAAMLSNFACSSVAVAFFKKYGLSIAGATDPADPNSQTNIAMENESSQFIQHSMITLKLLYWATGAIGMTWFNDFNLVGVKNVDAFTKTKK